MDILVIEDDRTTAGYVVKGLLQEGHAVDHLSDGRDAFVQAVSKRYDVIVVDRMLPGLDGLSLVRALRAAKVATPAVFLTALAGVDDRIEGLNAGGDDYLAKPFSFGELAARIAALGRRPSVQPVETKLTVDTLEIDLIRRIVTREGNRIDLLAKEFALLEHLVRRRGRVQSRTMLLEAIWGLKFDPQTNVIETHVSRLRAKVDRPFDKELIKTVRGVGYLVES